MDKSYLCQLCSVIIIFFHGVTDAVWTLTGSSEFAISGESFTLTCDPQDNSTVAEVMVWRRSGTIIATATFNYTCNIQNQDPQYQFTCEPGPIYKLTIPADMTGSQNNVVWRCESQFGGFGNTAEYTLTVAVPVSSLSMQGDYNYPALHVMYENTPKTFTCITNGCRPKANITITTTGVTEVQRTERQDTQSDGLFVTTVNQTITASRVGGVKTIQCSAVNIQGRQPVSSQTVILEVYLPVSSVSIQGDYNYPALNVIYENTPKSFICITNGCRPKANITVTTTGVTEVKRTERQDTQSEGLIATTVNQTITAVRGGGAKTIQCSAVNIQGRQPVSSQAVILEVYYVPTVEPSLSGYTNGTILYVGDNGLTLTCQQSGGYPLSTIMLSCDVQTGTPNSIGTVASSYLQLSVNRHLNGKTCTCTVRHPYIKTYTRTKYVTFIVYYPPTTPTLQTPGISFPWVENIKGVLKCITTPGNPPQTTYEWIQNSQVIIGQTSDTFTIPTLTSDYNGLRIQCRVSNAYTVQRPPAKISNLTVLDVQYSPIINLDVTNITVQEGRNLSRQCSADGNPTPTVKWYRGNSQHTSGTGTLAKLVFSDIDRGQADTYTCKATSTGIRNFESNKSVSVIVYYPPSITIKLQNTTENATNIMFTCNADGFPTNYTYHGWVQYIGDTVVRRNKDFIGMLSESNRKITFSKVTFEDIGKYHCDTDNGIQGRQPAVLQTGSSYFDVKAPAKFDAHEKFRKPGELHRNFTINIKFYSNPPAVKSDIKWINRSTGNQLTNTGVIFISLTSTQLQKNFYGKTVTLNGQSAMVSIASLKSFHLGQYTLLIQNGGIFISSFNFEIVTSAIPDAPSKFTLLTNKPNFVILLWERGFDGGHPQTFFIRYTDTITGETKEVEVEDTRMTSYYTAEITGLRPGSIYHFWIYSTNIKGNSTFSEKPIIAETLRDPELHSLSNTTTGAVIGVVGTVLAVIIMVLLVILLIIYRRRTSKSKNRHCEEGKAQATYDNVDNSLSMSEVNTYQTVNNTDKASPVYVNDANAYDSLEKTMQESEANTYETIRQKDSNENPEEKVYVNTTIM